VEPVPIISFNKYVDDILKMPEWRIPEPITSKWFVTVRKDDMAPDPDFRKDYIVIGTVFPKLLYEYTNNLYGSTEKLNGSGSEYIRLIIDQSDLKKDREELCITDVAHYIEDKLAEYCDESKNVICLGHVIGQNWLQFFFINLDGKASLLQLHRALKEFIADIPFKYGYLCFEKRDLLFDMEGVI
jgi:hypothetical protein